MTVFYIIIDSGVSYFYFKRFGGEYFADKGLCVRYIDTSYFTRPNSVQIMKYEHFSYPNTEISICKSFRDFEQSLLPGYNKSYAILSLVSNGFTELKLKRLLRKSSIKFGIDKLGLKYYDCDVINSAKRSNLNKFIDSLIKNGPRKTVNAVLRSLYQKFIYKDVYDFVLTISQERLNLYEPGFIAKDVIECHSWDYDSVIEHRVTDSDIPAHGYAVFLDQNIPFHPEIIDNKLYVTGVDKYFEGLNKLFDKIEKEFNVVVIIALHPTANKEMYKHLLKGRKLTTDFIDARVKSAEFVISHHTAAINFAVIHKKSLLFITNDSFEGNVIGQYIDECAISLGQSKINVDKPYDLMLGSVSDSLYELYISNHICSDIDNCNSNWDIFYSLYVTTK